MGTESVSELHRDSRGERKRYGFGLRAYGSTACGLVFPVNSIR